MRNRILRTAAAMLAAVLLSTGGAAAAEPPAVSARSAILTDAATGRVLFAQNERARSLIASTTKIMTALLVCERGGLQETVKIPREAVGVEGSSLSLREGETLTVEALLYGLMLQSGNDAAVALAIVCAGSVPDFAARMNGRAAALGLRDTHYANPHGLDDGGNYSTAADLAKLAAAALRNADFRRVVSCRETRIGGRALRNHNRLLFLDESVIGVKTGYTRAAGRILVSAADRGGRQLIAVTIGDPDDWSDHLALLQYGYGAFAPRTLAEKGKRLGTLPVFGGTVREAAAAAGETCVFPLAAGEEAALSLRLPPLLFAPAAAGAPVGTADFLLGGQVVASVPLVLAEEILAETPKK